MRLSIPCCTLALPRFRTLVLVVTLTTVATPLLAQTSPVAVPERGGLPTIERPATPSMPAADDPNSPDWKGAIGDSIRFLGLQHGARTFQAKTRRELAGPFFRDYERSLRMPRGWGDGDGWLANYVGHPIQGAASGFIWVQNDPTSRREEFGLNRRYWGTRWRALAWSAAYSVQFEIGPLSEASIGNVGLNPATLGWSDHVVTPLGGTALLVAEDALDKFLLRPLESKVRNRVVRAFTRIALNPGRSSANLAAGRSPWHRDRRPLVAPAR